MSAAVWPPISHDRLLHEEENSLKAELKWLLELLQENLDSLKEGLQECVELLAPTEPGTTLAISSVRSESVKGFVTRVGGELVKGDIRLSLPTLPPSPSSPFSTTAPPPHILHLTAPLPLPQLTALTTTLATALSILSPPPSTSSPTSATYITAQLKLLSDTLHEAATILNGSPPSPALSEDKASVHIPGLRWDDHSDDSHTHEGVLPSETTTASFSDLPASLSPHFHLAAGALVLTLRTLAPASDPPSQTTTLRARLGLGGPRVAPHDEMGVVFRYAGKDVVVREKVRVESLDPVLLAVGAKVGAVGREVEGWRGRVGAVVEGLEGMRS